MPKKKICNVSESTVQLIDMPKKRKKGRFRDRLRLLRFLKTGEAGTVTRAADLCNVSRLTAEERFRRYESGGITELLHLKTVPGRSRAIPAEVVKCLKERLSEPEGFGSYDLMLRNPSENQAVIQFHRHTGFRRYDGPAQHQSG